MSKLMDFYNLDLQKKKISYDARQQFIVNELNNLFNIIIEKKKNNNIFFSDIFNFFKKEMCLGLYIWGDVGRGKTYLVDLFFFALPQYKKIRLHYHHFMKLIHKKLLDYSGKKDPLKIIAQWFYKNYMIICLDEFFVKDIADAMKLSKLLFYFFDLGVYFIITSNIIPNKLYEGGLQRQKFLPAITLIEKYLKVLNVDGNIDYRYRNYNKKDVYLFPLSFKSFKIMKKLFLILSNNRFKRNGCIEILGRDIKYVYISGVIAWFDFNIICGFNRSQLDYIEIALVFNTIFISGVKIMTHNMESVARRFISMIDEFYDCKINVIISAECNINDLYNGDILKFDFKRTRSRLNEMSTEEYLKDCDKNVI